MKPKLYKILLMLLTIGLFSCNSNPENKKIVAPKSSYEKMEVVFIGNPRKAEIKPMLEKIMKFHGEEINENNINKSASVLVTLRKSSKNRVTEMDILKHMETNGTSELTFPNQAAISFTLLETN